MASLSESLINEFVKLTTPEKPKKSEAIVYGTVSKTDDNTYIKIDGSDIITPAASVAVVSDGDRVTAMLKNHSIMITGNITKPAAQEAQVKEVEKTANQAESSAQEANQNVTILDSKVDDINATLTESIENTQSSVEAAQQSADQAISDANEAYEKAGLAATAASNANAKAVEASGAAAQAMSDADVAYDAAVEAQSSASDAAKTATNYIGFQAGDGLTIGDLMNQQLGYNIKIDSSKMQIRNGYDKIISEYGAIIKLGLEAAHHTLIDNQGVSILNGTDVLSSFNATNIQLGAPILNGNNRRNITIDNDSVKIKYGNDVMSEYGLTTTIGPASGNHLYLDNKNFKVLSGDNVVTKIGVKDDDDTKPEIILGNPSGGKNILLDDSGVNIRTGTTSIASFGTDNSSNATIRLGLDNGDNAILNSNGMSINKDGTTVASFGDEIHLYKNGYSMYTVEGSSKISDLISNYRDISCSAIRIAYLPNLTRTDNVVTGPPRLLANTEYLIKTDVTETRMSGSSVTYYLNYIVKIGPTDIDAPSKFVISFLTPTVVKITGSNGTFSCLFYNLAESYSQDRSDLIRYDNRSYIEGSFRTKYDSGDLISQTIDTDESFIIGCDKQDQLCVNPRSIGSRSYDKTENGYDKFIPNKLSLNPEGGNVVIHESLGYDTSSAIGFIPKKVVIDENNVDIYQKDLSFMKYTSGMNEMSFSINNSGMQTSGIKHTASYDGMPYTHIHPTSNNSISFGIASGGSDRGIYDDTNSRWIINNDSSNNLNLATHDTIIFKSDTGSGYTTIKSSHSSGLKRPLYFDPPIVFSDQLIANGGAVISSGAIGDLSELSLKLTGMSSSEKPYFTKTNTININDFRSSGYSSISSSIPRINFVVPIDRPMVNVSSVSISNTSGFKIRQNGKYVLGSSSSAFVVSSSIVGYIITGSCIRIYASFSGASTTDFTANDTIAVEWNGTITFS